tara:strand:+ start:200 stop:595 length:396 start_codon:yes stop_codon:yes gene_type:complete
MKKLFFLLTSMFLLAGCIESVAVIGGGAANGKIFQSSIQSGASYAIKKKTGKTPIGHALNYAKSKKHVEKQKSCSSFANKKDLEICLMVKKRIISNQANIKEKESTYRPSKELTSSLQSSINKKSKIKYLD